MVGKLCAGPSTSASAGGLVSYLVGYAVAEKGASAVEIADALERVYLEAESRDDLGSGRIWSPEAGHGSRPSSVLTRNCTFSTAALEMDSDAAPNPGVKHGAMHFVWSFSTAESDKMTDVQVHQYVGEVLAKLGLGDHRSVAVVHRDTIVRDDVGKAVDGNLHVHVAVGTVHPETGLAFNKTGLFRTMARVEREVELANHLAHDHGLYTIQDPYTPQAFVREATPDELAGWRRQREDERLVSLERKSAEGYAARDRDFARYADATVGPRLSTSIDLSRERGRDADWATLHATAARFGCAIQQAEDGTVILRDVGSRELRLEHERERRDVRKTMQAEGADREAIDARVAEIKAGHEKAEAAERERKMEHGDTVVLADVLRDELADMGEFQNVQQSEVSLAALVEARPEIVLDDLTAQSSTFDRSDIDRWLTSRLTDMEVVERLGDRVMAHESVRALSADARYPLMTTTGILDIEDRLAADAREIAGRQSGFARADIERAMTTHEAQMTEATGKPFRLSTEQRDALLMMERGSLSTIEGLPGTGKTTVMSVVRILVEQQGRQIVGITLSQPAAERLADEAGFRCVNASRSAILERNGEQIVPTNGALVIDEAATLDSRAAARLFALARERNTVILNVGDLRQLQPVDAGASFRITRDAAKAAGTYAELRDVQRQKRAWHREAVIVMSDAIVEKDDAKRLALVRRSLGILERNGAMTWVADRDAAIDTTVTLARSYRAAGLDTVAPAADLDTVRHLNEENRRRAGLEGAGRSFVTNGGIREFAVGDRLMFLENSLTGRRALGVRNGDKGDVVEVTASRISVRLDGGDRVVEFSPRSYRAFDYANHSSVHKTQGASVGAGVTPLSRAASAELVFVAMSRSKHALDLVVPLTEFRDLDDVARHVSDRISLKTTSRTFEEIIERTGGRETDRIFNIMQQREALNDPMRRRYDAEVVEPFRAERAARMKDVRAVYDARKQEITRTGLDLSERLDASRSALGNFRQAVQEVHAETLPPGYSAWLREREADEQRVRDFQRGREQERVRDKTLTTPADRRKDPFRASNGTRERQHDHERDYGIER